MTARVLTPKPLTTGSLTATRLSMATDITFQALLVALLFIRPELDPSWQPISEYAIGRFGWIMVLAFLVSAMGYAALFVALKSQVSTIAGGIGLGILLVCAIGRALAGVFVTDPIETAQNALTTAGSLHTVSAGSALVLLPFAALLVNLSLARGNPQWSAARRALLVTAGLPLLGLMLFAVTMMIVVPSDGGFGPGVNVGWPNRFLLLVYTAWLVTLAWQAIRLGGER